MALAGEVALMIFLHGSLGKDYQGKGVVIGRLIQKLFVQCLFCFLKLEHLADVLDTL